MKTADEYLKMLKTENDLNCFLENSILIKADYKEKNIRSAVFRSKRSATTTAIEHFWQDIDGMRFRRLLEVKYHVDFNNKQEVSKLKTALLLYISEARNDRKSN